MNKVNINRLIDSLGVQYIVSNKRQVIKSVILAGSIEPKDIIIMVNSGYFGVGKQNDPLLKNETYLVPKGNEVHFFHGYGPYESVGAEGFESPEHREKYLKELLESDMREPGSSVFTVIGFDSLIHSSIPLFSILDLPNVKLGIQPEINELITKVLIEESSDKIGKKTLIKKYTEEIVIEVLRHLITLPELQHCFKTVDYLLDKRLIDIFQYIDEHLGEDLSNNKIAELAFVSKDYIGQFFKTLTGSNLQDYIENRRLEQAHYLLRNSKANIQEIALKIGFKDPAYFSRRFKIKYNTNAKEIRKIEYQVL